MTIASQQSVVSVLHSTSGLHLVRIPDCSISTLAALAQERLSPSVDLPSAEISPPRTLRPTLTSSEAVLLIAMFGPSQSALITGIAGPPLAGTKTDVKSPSRLSRLLSETGSCVG